MCVILRHSCRGLWLHSYYELIIHCVLGNITRCWRYCHSYLRHSCQYYQQLVIFPNAQYIIIIYKVLRCTTEAFVYLMTKLVASLWLDPGQGISYVKLHKWRSLLPVVLMCSTQHLKNIEKCAPNRTKKVLVCSVSPQ